MWGFKNENCLHFGTILGKWAIDPITKIEFDEVVEVRRGKKKEGIQIKLMGNKMAGVFRDIYYSLVQV